jgi:hydrogenase expression/formation protein HypE
VSEKLVGKPSPRRLEKILGGAFGAPSSKVLVGPGAGLDAAVLDLGDGSVMAIAEDPIFPAPKLPLEIMGWFTVHIGASDVAVTGIRPQYMTYTLLLPGTSPEDEARVLVGSISEAAQELGITIVGGHTGWYDAVNVPTVGGVTVWGVAPVDQWVSPGGARDGDTILMTKGPSIEAAALLAVIYRDRLEDAIEMDLLEKACSRVRQISVVADALCAFETGGVHAMHDATEGGVLGGLWEMHAASGLFLHADLDRIAIPGDVMQVADALNFDPWRAISEGTLLAAVEPGMVSAVIDAWKRIGIESFELGNFDASLEGNTIRHGGAIVELEEPGVDPFWGIFFAGLA